MLLVAAFVLCVASVPLTGGRLSALGEHKISYSWALLAALAIQIFVISIARRACPPWQAPWLT